MVWAAGWGACGQRPGRVCDYEVKVQRRVALAHLLLSRRGVARGQRVRQLAGLRFQRTGSLTALMVGLAYRLALLGAILKPALAPLPLSSFPVLIGSSGAGVRGHRGATPWPRCLVSVSVRVVAYARVKAGRGSVAAEEAAGSEY